MAARDGIAGRDADGSSEMFDRIAARYDLLNRVISLGLDRRWRRKLVRTLRIGGDDRVLDVAAGTGEVALTICELYGQVRVTALDPSGRMLAVGREKLRRAGHDDRVELVEADAQAMPFPDNSFAASCISFGIRNVPNRLRGVREMVRVTRPGGRVVVLELGEPRGGLLQPLARFHVHYVVPRVGALLSGAPEYRYLADSVGSFPSAPEFAELMVEAGARDVAYQRLSFGAAHLYRGQA